MQVRTVLRVGFITPRVQVCFSLFPDLSPNLTGAGKVNASRTAGLWGRACLICTENSGEDKRVCISIVLPPDMCDVLVAGYCYSALNTTKSLLLTFYHLLEVLPQVTPVFWVLFACFGFREAEAFSNKVSVTSSPFLLPLSCNLFYKLAIAYFQASCLLISSYCPLSLFRPKSYLSFKAQPQAIFPHLLNPS